MTAPTLPIPNTGTRVLSKITRLVVALLALFFVSIAVISLAVWLKNGHITTLFHGYILLWLIYGALSFFLLQRISIAKAPLLIFLLALLPRLLVCLAGTYTPTSDFANYWAMGQAFLQGDTATIATIVDHYRGKIV